MKHITALIAGSLLLSSCATVLTRKNYNFKINYATDGTKIRYRDSVYSQPASILVRRSKKPLVFTAFNDSVSRRYEIRPALNPMFVCMNLTAIPAYPLLPIVYGVDLSNPKRFHYGSKLNVELDDTSVVIIKPTVWGRLDKNRIIRKEPSHRYFNTKYTHQGDTYLSVSWPSTLYSTSNPGAGRKTAAGLLGITAGAEHYYKDRRALGITAGASWSVENWVTDSIFGGPESYTYETVSSAYLDLYHNHTINRFSFAYGINYTFTTWRHHYNAYYNSINPIELTPFKAYDERFNNHSLGMVISGYYHIKPFFHIGMVYRPTFLRIYPDTKRIYQHTISLDMAFTFKVRSKK